MWSGSSNRVAPRPSRLPLALIAFGTLAGVAAAWLAGSERTALPADAVARVNGVLLRRADYERLLAALASDRREPLGAADRRRVLDRLIEEELLLQHGIEIGLPSTDRRLREDLAAAVAAMVTAESQDARPAADELRRFYEEERQRFVRPGPVRVRQVFFRVRDLAEVPTAAARAEEAAARLQAGDDFDAVRARLGDAEPVALPDGWLSAERLYQLLGPTVSRTIHGLPVGGLSEPLRSGTGFHIVQVLDRRPDAAPPLEQIEDQVLAEYRRQAGEKALRAYLDDLRRRAEIEIIDSPGH